VHQGFAPGEKAPIEATRASYDGGCAMSLILQPPPARYIFRFPCEARHGEGINHRERRCMRAYPSVPVIFVFDFFRPLLRTRS